MKRILLLGLLAPIAGCGTPDVNDESSVIALDDGKFDGLTAAKSALPADAERIYFGAADEGYVYDDAPLAYRWFTAEKGVEFKVTVSENDENGVPVAGEHIGFKLQRAYKSNGKWKWRVVDQADGDGIAALKFKPGVGPSLYLITATASPLPANLTLLLQCGGEGCATAQQPGDACGGWTANLHKCDAGLYCSYSLDQACGAGDQEGVCAVKPQICPLFYRAVCGCDGTTYGNNCEAASHGTSVARVGECDVNITGSWEYITSGGAHIDYTFNSDGTFVSTDQPACAFTNPRCLIAIMPSSGSYTITSSTSVSLFYTSERRNGETATFSIEKGGTHLVGTDWSTALDLTRVK